MTRSVGEWIGANDDTAIPDRVRLRVWMRFDGVCHKCKRKITTGEKWTCEHLVALVNGGGNREGNLNITCDWCLPSKNAEDVAEKAATYRKRKANLGMKKSRNPMPGSRASGWKKTFNGWERR